ncbi:MAG: hypothetical protein ABJ239_06215 [Erythrobacter sp.]
MPEDTPRTKPVIDSLLRIAAWASLCSAITTALLIYGPSHAPANGLVEQAHLSSNWLYLYKPWVLFFHPQFAFIALIGAAALLWRKSPAFTAFGLFYLLVWAMTEMTQQAFIIDALNQYWRPGLLNAERADQRQIYESLLIGFPAISDSQYFVLLFGFGTGSILLGCAFLTSNTLGKVIGIAMMSLGLVSLTAFAGYYFSPAAGVTSITGWIYSHLYGPVQTGLRIALAIWLWHAASNSKRV